MLRANGICNNIIVPCHEAKSISTEHTFEEDTNDITFLHTQIVYMIEKIGYILRKQNKAAGCVMIKIRYYNFKTITKQISTSHTYCDDVLLTVALTIFKELYQKEKKIRLLGVRLSNLINDELQTDLFSSLEPV